MYNNLSLYRDNGLQKQAYQAYGDQGQGTPITLQNPNSSSLSAPINYGSDTTDYGGSLGGSLGGIPSRSNGTINLDEVSSQPFNPIRTGGTQGQNTGARTQPGAPVSVDLNTRPGVQIDQQDNSWATSYTMPAQPQAPQLQVPQPGTYTLPYQQGSPITLQGSQDPTTGQPLYPASYVTPEGSFGAYGLDQAMQNPNSLTMTHVNQDPLGYHFGPSIGMEEIMDENYSPTLGMIPSIPQSQGQQGGGQGGAQPVKDIFTSDYMLNNIAPSGAWGLGIGALAGALGGGNPVKTGLGAGVGAFGGKMLYDYLANNKDTQKYVQQFQDWASKNLWDGAGEHVKYLAPILGGLAGFAVTK